MRPDVDPVMVSGTWFRHVPADVDPTTRPYPPPDSRWQRGEVIDALYLAETEPCTWAEWYRHLAEAGMPPNYAMPRDLWRYEVKDLRVADLSDVSRLARVDLRQPLPGRRSWPTFQAVGERLYESGWRGVLAPSAARPVDRVLAVFLPDGEIAAELLPISHDRMTEPPAPPTDMRT